MSDRAWLINLADTGATRDRVGGKAAALGELAAARFPVPSGFVVLADAVTCEDLPAVLAGAAAGCGGGRFAVRSSGAAEDLHDASYAGLYETYLNVSADALADAVRACFAAAGADRVRAYHERRSSNPAGTGMAVLVQRMVDAAAAGVAFSAHPVIGDRDQIVVTAVRGLGEVLVAGEQTGEEWTIHDGHPTRTRASAEDRHVLDARQARTVADLAAQVAAHTGQPQDVEWAIDADGRLWLLQARPMTALPEQLDWTPPGPGLWMRNFRLGEWLPEAVTPLFATWLLPHIESGYLDGMHDCICVRVPFRWDLVNGWYYTATPIPTPRLLARIIVRGRGRALKTLFYALIRVGRDPVAADHAVLSALYDRWHDEQRPGYQALVGAAHSELDTASPARLAEIVTSLAREAGVYLWYLAIVGGSAWKMEANLSRFCRTHLGGVIDPAGGVQLLLRGLPDITPPGVDAHAVQSVDWYHPVAGELPTIPTDPDTVADRHARLAAERAATESASRAALTNRPKLLARFDALLPVAQQYAAIREQQARDFTLAWPVLRACAARLAEYLVGRGVLERREDLFFCTQPEVTAALDGDPAPLGGTAARRRTVWERQRRTAPLTLGRPPRLVGDVIDNAVREARGIEPAGDAIVGHPASAGRATGPVRLVRGPSDFANFADGDILVARATSPAWTPLFARAAAVITDGGSLAAHASLVAREYGIPAVVGTGDATSRLRDGQIVTVDGAAGTVTAST